MKALTTWLVEQALRAALTSHLGYEAHDPDGRGSGNSRNGTTGKTVQTEHGELPLEIPCARNGSFTPTLVKTRQRRLEGLRPRCSPCMPDG